MKQAVRTASILLVGDREVGKSTLFNSLTKARQRVVNAPGTTVALASGTWREQGEDLSLVDLPGTYSLIARSSHEHVAADAANDGQHDVAVVVLDATALSRSLYLLGQVATAGRPRGGGPQDDRPGSGPRFAPRCSCLQSSCAPKSSTCRVRCGCAAPSASMRRARTPRC